MREKIETIDDKVFERVWRLVEQIGVEERHFNDLQARYRSMASGWLLATFGAIGFVASETIQVGIDRELLIAGIAGAGCVGIALLWVVDLLVYHRLLDSCFIEGLLLEEQYRWLPPFRNNMMNTQKGEGVLSGVVGFYLGPIVLLILVAGGALSLWIRKEHLFAATFSFLITVMVAFLAGYVIRSRTENTAAIEKRLAGARKVDDSESTL
ncbi:MAG TPA: hypothetical protein ENJ83_03465 [Rhodospirillales bacterium]|nr:hypothetical protein [Rhodospirillales bacterium]